MAESAPQVAVVILNWKAREVTEECLRSLDELTYRHFSVFLVDNASGDGSFEQFQADAASGIYSFPLHCMQSGSNLGFAGGNNIGIHSAYQDGFPLYWLLNNDTRVAPGSLSALVAEMQTHPDTGIAGSKILFADSGRIWFAGGKVNTYFGKTTPIGFGALDTAAFNQRMETEYITGCSLFFRKALIDSIGLMKEDYFLYYEETDWNLRARAANWKVVYVPQSCVWHKVSVTTGSGRFAKPAVAYYDIRNAYLMIKRTQQSRLKTATAFLYKLFNVGKKLVKLIVYNQDEKRLRLAYIIKGLLANK
ncbi:MAG: glycosyltransferase family 2 protein [Sporolactobacillus sp.]